MRNEKKLAKEKQQEGSGFFFFRGLARLSTAKWCIININSSLPYHPDVNFPTHKIIFAQSKTEKYAVNKQMQQQKISNRSGNRFLVNISVDNQRAGIFFYVKECLICWGKRQEIVSVLCLLLRLARFACLIKYMKELAQYFSQPFDLFIYFLLHLMCDHEEGGERRKPKICLKKHFKNHFMPNGVWRDKMIK